MQVQVTIWTIIIGKVEPYLFLTSTLVVTNTTNASGNYHIIQLVVSRLAATVWMVSVSASSRA